MLGEIVPPFEPGGVALMRGRYDPLDMGAQGSHKDCFPLLFILKFILIGGFLVNHGILTNCERVRDAAASP